MSEFQRRQDAADIDAMISESQRPAPTDGWRPLACAPEGGLREATPADVREIRRALDDAYGPEDTAHAAAQLISVAWLAGTLLGIVLGFVLGITVARL